MLADGFDDDKHHTPDQDQHGQLVGPAGVHVPVAVCGPA